MRTLFRGGRIVSLDGLRARDVVVDNGRIADLALPSAALADDDYERTIDLDGALVFPGFIDPHVHSRDPGQTHKETFNTSTAAAALGGVTTILEMPNSEPPVVDRRTLETRARAFSQDAWVDFGLWGLAIPSVNVDSVVDLIEGGAVAIKMFTCFEYCQDHLMPTGHRGTVCGGDTIRAPNRADVLAVSRELSRVDGLLALHCEEPELLTETTGIRSYPDFELARPVVSESIAISAAVEIARATGGRIHVVHMSSGRGANIVESARIAGIQVSAETCPHYLWFDKAEADHLAARLKVLPPVRGGTDRDQLWTALRRGVIDSIGSDHAPHTPWEKAGDFADSPGGIRSSQTMAPLMIDQMLRRLISPQRLSWILSEGTARLFKLYPKKGAILIGSDADFTVVDPHGSWRIAEEDLGYLHKESVWAGLELKGCIAGSYLRGQPLTMEGKLIGTERGVMISPNVERDASNLINRSMSRNS